MNQPTELDSTISIVRDIETAYDPDDTLGSRVARKAREKLNNASREERDRLLKDGMSVIYSGKDITPSAETFTNEVVAGDIMDFPKPATINFLADRIRDRIDWHKDKGREIAQGALDVLENIVRTGWAINDVRRELHTVDGAFVSFVENNLPISVSQAYRFAAVSRKFKRDEEDAKADAEMRNALGMPPVFALGAFSEPLRVQIAELNPSSFSDLMRVSGLQKPKRSLGEPLKLQDRPVFLKVGGALSRTFTRLMRIDKEMSFESWGDEERKALAQDLWPFVELYERVTR